ncbi:MmgE/PrpD family protein [Roseomonas sp. BN140053]|uniref:MmgE/PrpD family protein n=1 Tax=Roseomonas sp. BN140053 TaxID=3391898 RepID=UPI0039EA901D
MDETTTRLAGYVAALEFTQLPAKIVDEARRRVLDTLGCAVAGLNGEPCRVARTLASRAEVAGGARLLGSGRRVLPELAAFANAAAARYLDGNDCYPGGGGHPSDAIPALLAVAEVTGADGCAFLAAVVAAYEVHYALLQALQVRERGIDHVFYTGLASAVGAAKLLGLPASGIARALSLAVVSDLPLEATRRGEISMWKGCAAANAARNGVFAALLAAEGMTAPAAAIDGRNGLRQLLDGAPLGPLGGEDGAPFRLPEADIKVLLTEYHAQGPVLAALSLRADLGGEPIARVTVHSYRFAVVEATGNPEKLRPRTRETADHSMPWLVAAALVEGRFGDDLLTPEHFADERILQMAQLVAIVEDPAFTRAFPDAFPCRVEITTASGRTLSHTLRNPLGHHDAPLSDAALEAKFRDLAGRALPPERVEAALAALRRLDQLDTLDPLLDALIAAPDGAGTH